MHLPWPVAGGGNSRAGLVTLTTSTLSEPAALSPPPGIGPGQGGPTAKQLAEWEGLGLDVPAAVGQQCGEAIRLLGRAAGGERGSPQSAALAEQCLSAALAAGEMLAVAYTEQVLAARRRQSSRPPTLLGADLARRSLTTTSPSATSRHSTPRCSP